MLYLQLEVVATDQGLPAESASTALQVAVLRNQFAPTFRRSLYTANVSESVSYSDVIVRVAADDRDALLQANVIHVLVPLV